MMVIQESASSFMLRRARDFDEWLAIGEPRTMARIPNYAHDKGAGKESL